MNTHTNRVRNQPAHEPSCTPIACVRAALFVLGLAVVLTAAGCEKEPIRAYQAPRDPPPPPVHAHAPNTVPNTAPTTAPNTTANSTSNTTNTALQSQPSQQLIVWDVPESWTHDPQPRQMREATFFAPIEGAEPVEIILTAFAGDVGGMLANVNRWRSQVGLDPIADTELADHLSTVDGLGGTVTIVRETGENNQQLLGTSVQPGDGKTWFVKSRAAVEHIHTIEHDLLTFAQSIRLVSGSTETESHAEDTPAQKDPSMGELANRLATWKPFDEWQWLDPTSSMVAASYVPVENTDVVVTVIPMRSDGGGSLFIVNMWRDQLSLEPVESVDAHALQILSPLAKMFDQTSADGSTRMVVVMVEEDGMTWFFKILGPADNVEAERNRFDAFIQRVGLGVEK